VEILGALLNLFGININSQDDEGNTVLHCMIQFYCDDLFDAPHAWGGMIETLLTRQVNPHLENLAGKTARQILEAWLEDERALPEDEKTANAEEAFGIGVVII
jgi:hypothetical protein